MHPDDLNTIWYCEDCHDSFFFNSDVDDHKHKTGHNKIRKISSVSGGMIWLINKLELVFTVNVLHF